MKASDIKFIPNNFCANNGYNKDEIFMLTHIFDHECTTSYQQVINNHSGINQETIIQKYTDIINSEINVTKKLEWLINTNDFINNYCVTTEIKHALNKSINYLHYPEYHYTINMISTDTTRIPDKLLVCRFHEICPSLCGIFFENILAYSLKLTNFNVHDLSNVLLKSTMNSCESLTNMLTNGLIRNIYSQSIEIDDNIIYVDHELLNENHFVDMFHYILFASIKHFMRNELYGDMYEQMIKFECMIKNNSALLYKYYKSLMQCTYLKQLIREDNLQHSLSIHVPDLHGEIDFVSRTSIIDCKTMNYSNKDQQVFTKWFVQLYMYQLLRNTTVNNNSNKSKLIIINLYTNEVIEFIYT